MLRRIERRDPAQQLEGLALQLALLAQLERVLELAQRVRREAHALEALAEPRARVERLLLDAQDLLVDRDGLRVEAACARTSPRLRCRSRSPCSCHLSSGASRRSSAAGSNPWDPLSAASRTRASALSYEPFWAYFCADSSVLRFFGVKARVGPRFRLRRPRFAGGPRYATLSAAATNLLRERPGAREAIEAVARPRAASARARSVCDRTAGNRGVRRAPSRSSRAAPGGAARRRSRAAAAVRGELPVSARYSAVSSAMRIDPCCRKPRAVRRCALPISFSSLELDLEAGRAREAQLETRGALARRRRRCAAKPAERNPSSRRARIHA